MNTVTIKARAQEIVRAKYPNAIEVATGPQIWRQSPDITISKAYTFAKSGNGSAKMAWCNAASQIINRRIK